MLNPINYISRFLRETGGPTVLTLGSVADGLFLQRSGTTCIGTAADRLTALGIAEVSVTGVITLTSSAFGKLHNCTGSAYTITLPAASGNGGKFIGFRINTTSYAIVTLDGNAGETIGGATTAQYTATEWVVLYCDGSNWWIDSEWLLQPTFNVALNGNQTVNSDTFTKLSFATENEDSHGWFDAVTNYRWTPKAPGIYRFVVMAYALGLNDGRFFQCTYYKNGASDQLAYRFFSPAANSDIGTSAAHTMSLNGSTDYVEVFVYQDQAPSILISGTAGFSRFSGNRVRRL